MKQLYEDLIQEKQYLQDIIARITKSLECAPEGGLRIVHSARRIQYYNIPSKRHKCEKDDMENGSGSNKLSKQGDYIRKSDIKLAYDLAQRDYDADLLKLAQRRLAHVQAMLKDLGSDEMERVYEELNPYRKKLVTPRIISDEEYARRWSAIEFERKSFEEGTAVIMSDKGERVRSKSEKIIADTLHKKGIPYRYEAPLTFKNGKKIHPDFTVLNQKRRQEVYWEHLGMMDNTEYCENALGRIEIYQRNNIILGNNLIVSYETSRHPIETTMIERNIQEYCLK